MEKKKCAIFSCLGLGDGLISLVLSNNLQRSGFSTLTFHPSLQEMQPWFPNLEIKSFPSKEEMEEAFKDFDHFYIFFEKSPWMKAVIDLCLASFKDKVSIINPIASPKTNYPYWQTARFNGARPFVDNLRDYCQKILHLSSFEKSNGITPPVNLVHKKHKKRVVIHPTSSREGKNWPKEKYLKLSELLSRKGYEPVFILTEQEKGLLWPKEINAPHFSSLCELTSFVYESGFMIGNDSGIGHLASCLGISTLTICRSKMASNFWRPSWAKGEVILPPSWVPNLKGLRLRDKHWKKWISVRKVASRFDKLANSH